MFYYFHSVKQLYVSKSKSMVVIDIICLLGYFSGRGSGRTTSSQTKVNTSLSCWESSFGHQWTTAADGRQFGESGHVRREHKKPWHWFSKQTEPSSSGQEFWGSVCFISFTEESSCQCSCQEVGIELRSDDFAKRILLKLFSIVWNNLSEKGSQAKKMAL